VRPILQERDEYGEYNLVKTMYDLDAESFKSYFRMNRETFDELQQLTEPLGLLHKKAQIGGVFQQEQD